MFRRRQRPVRAWSATLALPLAIAGFARAAAAGDLDCLIQPWRTIEVSAPIEGLIATVPVTRGDLVEEGQVVATLESTVEEATLEIARARAKAVGTILTTRARLDFAELSLARQNTLSEQKVVAESKRDEAQNLKAVAEAQVTEAREVKQVAELEFERAQAALKLRTIRSPVRGVVTEEIVSAGEYAEPPQILKIAQIDPLRVEVFAPLELVGRIAVGMEAQIKPEAPVGGSHTAKVVVVDRVIDAASGTFGVRLELPNPDYALPAGLNCRVVFPVDGIASAPPGAGSRIEGDGANPAKLGAAANVDRSGERAR